MERQRKNIWLLWELYCCAAAGDGHHIPDAEHGSKRYPGGSVLAVCKCDDLFDRTDMRSADGCSGNDKNFFWNMGTLRMEAVSVRCDRYRTGTCISLCVPVLKQIEEKDDERKTIDKYRTY